MSEKKEVKKTEKPGFFTRAKNWIVALPGRIATAFKNMVAELKKVAWPSKKDLVNYSIVVIGFVVALAVIVGLLDTASSFMDKQLIQLYEQAGNWREIMTDEQALWYVVHTYSGYENKVATDLVKQVENNGMGDLIQDVKVPIEEVVEIRNGKPHTIQHKLFPGYVLVKMIKTTETWYVVRNTRGVTGFVGPGSEPIPLTDEEFERMTSCQGTIRIDLQVGDNVRIKTGSVENAIGTIEEINAEEHKVKVSIEIFSRKVVEEYDVSEVERL